MNSAPSYSPRLLPLRLPRVCVAVIGSDANEMAEKAEALVRDNSFLEFRLDYLSKPGLGLPRIKRFLEIHPGTVVIATCRRAASGGKFRGSIASQLDILEGRRRWMPTGRRRASNRQQVQAGATSEAPLQGRPDPFVS